MNIFRKIFGWFISLFVYRNKSKPRKLTKRAIKKHNESVSRAGVSKTNKVIIFHRPEDPNWRRVSNYLIKKRAAEGGK